MKKALIIFVSPHKTGNTAALVNVFKENFNGEIEQINLFPNLGGISPCIDCGGCKKIEGCVINDDFYKITKDDYDVLVVASPIYMSNMPPPFWNLISRLNYTFVNRTHLKQSKSFKEKEGVLILTGGGSACKRLMGETNEEEAIKQTNYVFKKLNASPNYMFLSLKTNIVPAEEDENIKQQIEIAAKKLSE